MEENVLKHFLTEGLESFSIKHAHEQEDQSQIYNLTEMGMKKKQR